MTREFGGTGLGLAISKRLSKMMDGSIRVEGEEGMGCVFTVQVRLGWQSASENELSLPADQPEESEEQPLDLSGLHMLVVEDNEINRGIAEAMLTGMGVTVDTAINGKLGVEKVAMHRYDAVLMDMQMPVMDGYQAITEIREMDKGKGLPIIALTAHAMEYDRERCLRAGANDYVSKPVNRQHVQRVLARFFGEDGDAAPALLPQDNGPAVVADLKLVDREGALVRLGVNDEVYDRVVDTFCNDYSEFPERLDVALQEGDVVATQTLIHSLKGSSSTVGAESLSAYARQLEDICKAGNLPDEKQVTDLFDGLGEVLRVFGFSGKEEEPPVQEEEGAEKTEVTISDRSLVVKSLEELAESLEQSMYDSINSAFGELEKNFTSPDLARLDQMIRMYQYEDAYELVEKILADLPD